MQTQVPAQQVAQHQSTNENKSSQFAETQFEDASPQTAAQLRMQSLMSSSAQTTQLKSTQAMMAAKPNQTGLPNQLKAGIENLSGMSMDHVRVHYNSDKPAQLQAHAYAQGSEIHVAPGQEKHLPHEAWHVVQQAQGRVKPTVQMQADTAADTQPIQLQRIINFDASAYAVGLNGVYDATQTHFSFLSDDEIGGGGGMHMAQVNENLHITFQSADRTNVAHYFYNSLTKVWRLHAYGPGGHPAPYAPGDAQLAALQARAIEFGWPPAAVIAPARQRDERTPEEIEERRIAGEQLAAENLRKQREKREADKRAEEARIKDYEEREEAEKLQAEKERAERQAKALAEEERLHREWQAEKAKVNEQKRKKMLEQEERAKVHAARELILQAEREAKAKKKAEAQAERERLEQEARAQKAAQKEAREAEQLKIQEEAARKRKEKAAAKAAAREAEQAAREAPASAKPEATAVLPENPAVADPVGEHEDVAPARDDDTPALAVDDAPAVVMHAAEPRAAEASGVEREAQSEVRRQDQEAGLAQELELNQEAEPAQRRWLGPLAWVLFLGTVGASVIAFM